LATYLVAACAGIKLKLIKPTDIAQIITRLNHLRVSLMLKSFPFFSCQSTSYLAPARIAQFSRFGSFMTLFFFVKQT
jgi:hypothetical protein